ncbi:MAG TPA: YibE/F family protein [Candidatus Gemmiger avicola]|uniref:YibE/F family protein n=1 Tax=Candidatus Gemmiger avicola TaxID=2838605 RepID=A0A9D2M5P3_9FIRM|nr:YibE/F family protein [Candidatus Gemmiger avicola]
MAVALALTTLLALLLQNVQKTELINRTGQTFEKGVVTEVLVDNLQPDGTRVGEQRVAVRMTTGVRKGQVIEMTSSAGYLFGATCTPGLRVIVMQSVAGDTTVSSVYSQDRGGLLLLFAALYLVALVVIGGKQGLKGALGLAFTFLAIIFLYLPLVYLGWPPLWTSVLICAVTTAVTMYFIGGPTRKTVVASAGTVAGVVIAGLVAAIFGAATGISGWNVSDIETLITLWNTNGINVGELLFAGLLISSLGAVMDVAMSVASSMGEVLAQNPAMSRGALFASGMRIGRDMMGTDSNTLILAFAGGSVSMLVLDYAYDLPILQILNSNNIGISVMQGLAGSFGVVLAVPVTVALATLLYTAKRPETVSAG